MMDPELKAKWVAALRSGNYHQARKCMVVLNTERGSSYCCLAVLEKVRGLSDEAIKALAWETEELGYMTDLYHEEGTEVEHGVHSGIPVSVREKLVVMNDGEYTYENERPVLIAEPKSFKEIADWIEQNL